MIFEYIFLMGLRDGIAIHRGPIHKLFVLFSFFHFIDNQSDHADKVNYIKDLY